MSPLEMLALWPELGETELHVEESTTHVSSLIPIVVQEKKENKPLLCVDCHWISMPYNRNPDEARCFAQENYAGINVVDGSRVYFYPLCKDYRSVENRHPSACGIQGKWWKQRELPPVENVTIGGQGGTNLELVVGKKEPKFKVPVLKRLSKSDLDDI